ncbi:hypothetical protein ACJX0J_007429, partial [Zea mays]
GNNIQPLTSLIYVFIVPTAGAVAVALISRTGILHFVIHFLPYMLYDEGKHMYLIREEAQIGLHLDLALASLLRDIHIHAYGCLFSKPNNFHVWRKAHNCIWTLIIFNPWTTWSIITKAQCCSEHGVICVQSFSFKPIERGILIEASKLNLFGNKIHKTLYYPILKRSTYIGTRDLFREPSDGWLDYVEMIIHTAARTTWK